jgi:4-amino-4-deoxy-L-arabinose transferase-like glycosyltransferase
LTSSARPSAQRGAGGGAEPGRSDRTGWREAAAIGAGALAVRLVNLGHTPYVDELNHLVAAAALTGGEGAGVFRPDYEYTRALPFTWMVAASFAVFGEGLEAARLPAVIAGTLLVVVVFLWVRTSCGRWEAWTAGVLLLLAPQAIYHSQLARFYSFQALFVVGAAWCAYRLAGASTWRSTRAALAAAGGAALAGGAMVLQLNSLVGLAAIAAWLVGALGLRAWRSERPLRAYAGPAVVVAAALLAAVAWLHLTGTVARGLSAFGRPGIWAEGQADSLRYYHSHFLGHYPLLWAPFPLVALLAVRRRPGPASLWLAVFGAVFVVHSLAAWKADRYIFYVLPYFFMLTGVVVGPLLRWIHAELAAGIRAMAARPAARSAGGGEAEGARVGSASAHGGLVRSAPVLAAGVLTLGLLFAAWGNAAFSYSARMLVEDDHSWPFPVMYRGEADWAAAARALGSRADEVEVVMTTTELKAGYYLGRQDLILSRNYLSREPDGTPHPEYNRNVKTGLPVISLPGSLEAVIACHRSGILLVENNHWGQPWSVGPELAAFIEERIDRIELDPGWRLHAFGWDHGKAFDPPEGCYAIPS